MVDFIAPPDVLRFFHYYPNKPLAIVGLVVFAVIAVALTARIFKTKSRHFLYILPITALVEAIGYVVRLLCASDTTLGKYIAMTLFLLLSPNALALVNYKALGEVIKLSNVQTNRFFLRPKFVTWFFFWSDIFVFFMQGAGGGLQSMGIVKMNNIGRAVTLVGLAVQLVFFFCFGLITFHVDRNPAYNYTIQGQTNLKGKLVRCLLITLALLYVRSIYRVAEYAAGFDGVIASAEWAFYVFDSLVIAIAFLFYFFMFIGDYLPRHGDPIYAQQAYNLTNSSDHLTCTENGYEMHTDAGKYSAGNA